VLLYELTGHITWSRPFQGRLVICRCM